MAQEKRSFWNNFLNKIQPLPRPLPVADVVKLEGDFAKAKRNLLWFGTFAVLFGSAAFFSNGQDCFSISMTGNFGLPPIVVAISLTLYGIYLSGIYWYEVDRSIARNSKYFHPAKNNDFESQMNKIAVTLKGETNKIIAANSIDLEAAVKSIEGINLVVEKDDLDTINNAVVKLKKDAANEIVTWINSHISENPRKMADRFDSIRENLMRLYNQFRIETIDPLLAKRGSYADHKLDLERLRQRESESAIQIQKSSEIIEEMGSAIGKLSNDIRKADRKKFAIADLAVPIALTVFAFSALVHTLYSSANSPSFGFSCGAEKSNATQQPQESPSS